MGYPMNRAVRHTIVTLGVAATLVSIGGADTVALQNRERLDLSGTWTLDRSLAKAGEENDSPNPPGACGVRSGGSRGLY